jgi:hypothetical protein
MIAQHPLKIDSERPVSTPRDRNFSAAPLPKPMSGVSGNTISKTPKPRFEKVNISWEYFQNELEFE